jgi:hypothetical protein
MVTGVGLRTKPRAVRLSTRGALGVQGVAGRNRHCGGADGHDPALGISCRATLHKLDRDKCVPADRNETLLKLCWMNETPRVGRSTPRHFADRASRMGS